jgi:hypothetical protein
MKNITEKIAFDLFREWTKKAVNAQKQTAKLKVYCYPHC